jgi:hypothetical protein
MAEAPLKDRRLGSVNDPAFEAFWAIYTESIPAREQKSRPDIEAMLAREDYLFLLLEQGEAVLGFSILFVPKQASFFLLEYLAIDRTHRQGGRGGELLKRSFHIGFQDPQRTCCLLEVETPCVDGPEWDAQVRRQKFYGRYECKVVPLPGDTPAPPMDLLAYFPVPRPSVTRAEIETWLRVIYADVYGCPSTDPRIQAMLEAVSNPTRLI